MTNPAPLTKYRLGSVPITMLENKVEMTIAILVAKPLSIELASLTTCTLAPSPLI